MSMLKKLSIDSLKVGWISDGEIFLSDQSENVILPAYVRIPEFLPEKLKIWGFDSVYTSGEGNFSEDTTSTDQGERSESTSASHDVAEVQATCEIYRNLIGKTQEFYTTYREKNYIIIDDLVKILRDLYQFFREKRNFLVRFSSFRDICSDYFINHSLQTTIICFLLGEDMKLPAYKLVDLGMVAFLHEIGHLHLPPGLYNNAGSLTSEEKRLLSSHVVVGYRELKRLSFVQDVLLGVLQHHENVDGSGYLQGLKGDQISPYARIVSIACSYCAQISDRPHREARTEHASILSIMKDIHKKYDEILVNSLVSRLSLFPIGSYVRLSDNSVGIVIDTNPGDVKNPVVRVVLSNEGLKVGAAGNSVIRLGDKLSIISVLTYREFKKLVEA